MSNNPEADKVKRVVRVLSYKDDPNHNFPSFFNYSLREQEYPEDHEFIIFECGKCHSRQFEVLYTDSYETSCRCVGCGYYYVAHTG